jgi:uncharacterized protein YceK
MYNKIKFLVIVVILLIGIVSMALYDSKEANAQSKMTGDTAKTAKNMTRGANMPMTILDIPQS